MKQGNRHQTYYDVLGLTPSADSVVIAATYRALIKKYHPDANAGDEDATEKARQLNEAYEVLGDADARARYDYFTLGRWSAPAAAGREAMGFAGPYQFDIDAKWDHSRRERRSAAPVQPEARDRKRLLIAVGGAGATALALAAMLWFGGGEEASPPFAAAPLVQPADALVGPPVSVFHHRKPRLSRAWLAGSWVVEGVNCKSGRVVTLAPDGSWSRANAAGRWTLEGDQLHLMTTTVVEASLQRTLHVPHSRTETVTVRGPREYKSVDARGRTTIYDRCSPPPPG